MNKETGNRLLLILSLIAAAALFAGCAGSGGGGSSSSASSSGQVSMRVQMRLPAGAGRAAAATSNPYDTAIVAVFEYDEQADYTVNAASIAYLSLDSDTNEYVGNYSVLMIPPGNNYICEAFIFDTNVDPGDLGTELTSATPTAIVAAIVDSVQAGVTTTVDVDSLTTVAAVATLYYAQQQTTPVALDNTSVITTTVKNKISDAVDDLYASGTLTDANIMANFTSPNYHVFDEYYWTNNTTLKGLLDAVLDEAGLTSVPTPSAPAYVYDGLSADVDTQTSTSTLSANWAPVTNATAYYYSAGTTSGASTTVSWTSATGTSVTKSGLTLTASQTYYFSVKAMNSAGAFSSITTSDGVTVTAATSTADTTPPQVSSTVPTSGQTGVASDGTAFKVIFNESMDSSVTLAGYSMTIVSQTTSVTLTINSTNSASYGAFTWSTTTNSNDTLTFTLKPSATLTANSLKTLKANTTYNITSWTAPTNLKDTSGNAISTTGISTTGSFTTAP